MTREDHVFIANVVVIDPMWETMASSVITRPIGVVANFNDVAKIHKYRGFHEEHHFLPMAMEVHSALGCDMDRFMKECTYLIHDRQ
jgi:hypothetical protein